MKLRFIVVVAAIAILCMPAFAQTTARGIDRGERNANLDIGEEYASDGSAESTHDSCHECPSGMVYVDKIGCVIEKERCKLDCPDGYFCLPGLKVCIGRCDCPPGYVCIPGVEACIAKDRLEGLGVACTNPGGTCADGSYCLFENSKGFVCCPSERACLDSLICCNFGWVVTGCEAPSYAQCATSL